MLALGCGCLPARAATADSGDEARLKAALESLRAAQQQAGIHAGHSPPADVDALEKASRETQALLPKDSPGLRTEPLIQTLRNPKSPLDERRKAARTLQQRTDALNAALSAGSGGLASSAGGSATDQQIQDTLKRVLSRKEFRHREPSLWERFWNRFWERVGEWLMKHFPSLNLSGGNDHVLRWIVFGLAIGVFLFLIFYLARLITKQIQPERVNPLGDSPTGPATLEEYLREAERLARTGDFRTALERAYVGTLLHLGEGNVLEFRPTRTNWENLRTLSAAFPRELARTLRGISGLFDRKWYGQETLDEAEYTRAADALERVRTGVGPTNAAPAAEETSERRTAS